MKKTIFALSFLYFIFVCPAFSIIKNIVYSQSFDSSQIFTLSVDLVEEDVFISQIYGDEISVEISSNNLNLIPKVELDDEVLSIKTGKKIKTTGSHISVYIYIPQDWRPDLIDLHTVSGNIDAQNLSSIDAIKVYTVSGNINSSNSTSDYLQLSSTSGKIVSQKTSAQYFRIDTTSGNIFCELNHEPFAQSSITSVSGKIQVYYPQNADFESSFKSLSGTIKIDGTKYSKALTSSLYSTFGNGGSIILFDTVSGSIELKSY